MKSLIRYICTVALITGTVSALGIASAAPNPLEPLQTVQKVLSNFQSLNDPSLHFNPLQNDGTIWWIAPDNTNLLLNESPQFQGYITPFSISTSSPHAFSPRLQQFIKQVDDMMVNQGFTLDTRNSSQDYSDKQFYDFVHGYQKNDTACVLRIDPDRYGYSSSPTDRTEFDFGCSNQIQKYYAEQAPMVKALIDHEDGVVISQVLKSSGDFVFVSVHARRTGYAAILQKVSDQYKLIFAGQEIPECSLMKKYNVPQELYGECYDDSTSKS